MDNVVFKANAYTFNGIPGYIMKQFIAGDLVCALFISESSLALFQKIPGCEIVVEKNE